MVEEMLDDKMFVVEITVSERNAINVFVDSFDGLTMNQCMLSAAMLNTVSTAMRKILNYRFRRRTYRKF